MHARPSRDQKAQIISAGYPIRAGGEILGAVVVEQNSNVVLALQYRLLRSLTVVTILVFAFLLLALLFFAWRLTSRVKNCTPPPSARSPPKGACWRRTFPGGSIRGRVGRPRAQHHQHAQAPVRLYEVSGRHARHPRARDEQPAQCGQFVAADFGVRQPGDARRPVHAARARRAWTGCAEY